MLIYLHFTSNVKLRWWKAEAYLHHSCSTCKEISTHSQGQQWHQPQRERTLFCSPICHVPSLTGKKPLGGGHRAGTGSLSCFSKWCSLMCKVWEFMEFLSLSAWTCLACVFVTGYQTNTVNCNFGHKVELCMYAEIQK